MKRYIVHTEYYDYNGSYEIHYTEFNSLIAAKYFFHIHKKRDYTLIKLTDTFTQKEIKKIVKI